MGQCGDRRRQEREMYMSVLQFVKGFPPSFPRFSQSLFCVLSLERKQTQNLYILSGIKEAMGHKKCIFPKSLADTKIKRKETFCNFFPFQFGLFPQNPNVPGCACMHARVHVCACMCV